MVVTSVALQIAIKFDPFMYLSLAIPSKKKWTGQITLVPDDARKPHVKVGHLIAVSCHN